MRIQDDEVTYETAHKRVFHIRGKVSSLECLDCGEPAKNWAYNNRSHKERVMLQGPTKFCRYSPDPYDYDPLCVTCHRARDWADEDVCPQGHDMRKLGIYVHPRGSKLCKECARIRSRNYRERKKA